MRTVATFEAKNNLSALLEQVAQRGEVAITRRGKAIARLVPVAVGGDDRLARTVARLKGFRRGRRLGDERSLKSLIEEGRR